MVAVSPAVTLRPYGDEDEAEVLQLLTASLGGGPAGRRPPEFFRWKHLENPFGRSYMLLAETGGKVVGFRSFMRWRFELSGGSVNAVRAVDTATHPDYQGLGIFRRLTTTAIEELRSDTDLVFNTPNDKSLPGYLKMGWRIVGDRPMPIRVRVRKPVRFIRHLGSRHDATEHWMDHHATAGDSALSGSPELSRQERGDCLRTALDDEFLRWRYLKAPLLNYQVAEERDDGGSLRGTVVYRVRPRGHLREATVVELFVGCQDRACAARLLRRVSREAEVDHLTCSFPAGSVQASAAARTGFFPSPEGMTLVANPLRDVAADVFSRASWSLTLGDLEVF
jgi:GNAT superfamily N-acetyltransferase